MNLLLLPFVNLNDASVKTGDTYLGVYNMDFGAILSIEPDEDGHTVVYHRTGGSVVFDVPFIEFCKQFHDSQALNFYFSKYVNKKEPNFIKAIKLTDKSREE